MPKAPFAYEAAPPPPDRPPSGAFTSAVVRLPLRRCVYFCGRRLMIFRRERNSTPSLDTGCASSRESISSPSTGSNTEKCFRAIGEKKATFGGAFDIAITAYLRDHSR